MDELHAFALLLIRSNGHELQACLLHRKGPREAASAEQAAWTIAAGSCVHGVPRMQVFLS